MVWVTTAVKQIARVLTDRQQGEAAEIALRLGLEIDPHQRDAIEQFVALRLSQCRWPVTAPLERLDSKSIVRGIHPLSMAAYTDDPLLQLASASARYVKARSLGSAGTIV